MKKCIVALISISLIFTSFGPIMAQKKSDTSRLSKLKSRLNKEINEFFKCIKGDKNCDPVRKKIYITAGALVAILLTAAGLTAWQMKRIKSKPKGNDEEEEDDGSEEEIQKFKKNLEILKTIEEKLTEIENLKRTIESRKRALKMLQEAKRLQESPSVESVILIQEIDARFVEAEKFEKEAEKESDLQKQADLLEQALDALMGHALTKLRGTIKN